MAAQYVAALAARLPEDPRHHHGVALAEVFAATKPRGQAAVVLSYLTASTDASSYQILDERDAVVVARVLGQPRGERGHVLGGHGVRAAPLAWSGAGPCVPRRWSSRFAGARVLCRGQHGH